MRGDGIQVALDYLGLYIESDAFIAVDQDALDGIYVEKESSCVCRKA